LCPEQQRGQPDLSLTHKDCSAKSDFTVLFLHSAIFARAQDWGPATHWTFLSTVTGGPDLVVSPDILNLSPDCLTNSLVWGEDIFITQERESHELRNKQIVRSILLFLSLEKVFVQLRQIFSVAEVVPIEKEDGQK
jgi:hypothetical protein